jgi:hypothetical protein
MTPSFFFFELLRLNSNASLVTNKFKTMVSIDVFHCSERYGRLIRPPAVLSKPSQAFLSNQARILTDPTHTSVIEEEVGKIWDRQSYHIIDYQSLIGLDLENILAQVK